MKMTLHLEKKNAIPNFVRIVSDYGQLGLIKSFNLSDSIRVGTTIELQTFGVQ